MRNLHAFLSASNSELNIFWPVYKQHRLFPTAVNSNHEISWREELFNAFSYSHFVVIQGDPAQSVFLFFGNSSLWWKSARMEASKINQNDSTPKRELLLVVLLAQPHEINCFCILLLCSLLWAMPYKGCFHEGQCVLSLQKWYLHKALPSILQERWSSFPFLYFLYSWA